MARGCQAANRARVMPRGWIIIRCLGNGINAGRRYSAFIASVFVAVGNSTGTRRVAPTIADPNVILTNPIVAAMTAAPIKPE